jgi:hypothetical protein
MIGLGGVGVATSVMAAEIANVKSTNTAMTNIPGIGVSKRVGGLANKIRGICLYMVRLDLQFLPLTST